MIFIIIFSCFLLSGCWNYREIDDLGIVAGVAIDEGFEKKYKFTIEVVYVSGGIESKVSSRVVSIEGNSVFEASRNAIAVTGKRLYWSHSKVLVVSKKIAEKGITKIVDWFIRDAETRSDAFILISNGETAHEIFDGVPMTEEIVSFELEETLLNNSHLSKAPKIKIWQFANCLAGEGISPKAPAIQIEKVMDKIIPIITGTAIFKGDKLVGFIDGEETKYFLFIVDEVKGGVLTYEESEKREDGIIALEIFDNKTRIKPVVSGNDVEIDIKLKTVAAINEISLIDVNFVNREEWRKLEAKIGKMLENNIKETIEKMQQQYSSDIFGFGKKVYEDNQKVWNSIGDRWDEVFQNLKVNIKADVSIKNSAVLSEPLEVRN